MEGPIQKTPEQLQAIIAENLSKILGSCIHSSVFDRRPRAEWYKIHFHEIEANLHLWERLGTAHEALKALRDYEGTPRGFVKVEAPAASG